MRKTMLLILIIVLSIVMIYGIVFYFGVVGFSFAWILNFMLMMCALTFTEVLNSKLSSHYYNEKGWERKGKIYEILGVNFYRKLLVFAGWEKLNKKANPVKNNIDALRHLEYKTKQSELGHTIIFIIVLGFTIYVATNYTFAESLWLLFLNIMLNAYPILLQRYNRPRLRRILKLTDYKERTRITAIAGF